MAIITVKRNTWDKSSFKLDKPQINIAGNRMIKAIMAKRHHGTPLLPPGTRFYRRYSNDFSVVVVEEKPKVRTMRWWDPPLICKDDSGGSQLRNFRLATPYIIWLFICDPNNEISIVSLWYAKQPLSSLNRKLYVPSLSNVESHDSRVCLGGQYKHSSTNLIHNITRYQSIFWQSEFGINDFTDSGYSETGLSLQEWGTKTKRNPRFVLRFNWLESSIGIAETIDEILGDNTDKDCVYGEGYYHDDLVDLAVNLPRL